MKSLWNIFIYIIICITLTSCFGNYTDRIRIDGSSSLFPLTEAVAEEFRKEYPEIKITVGVSGTSGGFKKLARNEIDIADASRPISANEIEQCKKSNISFIEIPVSNDAIVVAINPENTFVDYLSVYELKKIWEPEAQGKIKYWDQIREGWPHIPIQLFGAGTSSGSFDFFTSKIIGIKKASRGDYTASEDDNMLVQGVAGAKGALGYFGLSYYLENKTKIKVIPIDDGNNENGDGAIFPNDTSIKEGYYQPLSRTEFIYINANAVNKEIIEKFVNYYLKNAHTLLNEVGGIPLMKESYKEAEVRYQKRIKGSLFINEKTINGKKLLELLKKDNAKNI